MDVGRWAREDRPRTGPGLFIVKASDGPDRVAQTRSPCSRSNSSGPSLGFWLRQCPDHCHVLPAAELRAHSRSDPATRVAWKRFCLLTQSADEHWRKTEVWQGQSVNGCRALGA